MKKYLTVSEITNIIKNDIESDFLLSNILILGEVTSLTKHYSGHYYFSLKDDNALLKCVMFSRYASLITFPLKNGDQILITGYIGLYEKSGTYQCYVDNIFPFGEGNYLLKLQALKKKLTDEGLFSKEKKKIPFLPKKIGLITAKVSAAIHDYLTTVRKRFPTDIYIFPSLMQGENASKDIIRAIDEALKLDIDLLVITRGGGGKEDLITFNDESLVRKCALLDIPLITAIGHQIDSTLIDYVSSLTAITPTDAAVKSVPDINEVKEKIFSLNNRLNFSFKKYIDNYFDKLIYLEKIVNANNPAKRVENIYVRLNTLTRHLNQTFIYYQQVLTNKIHNLSLNLEQNFVDKINNLIVKINNNIRILENLSPYLLLENGYLLAKIQNRLINKIDDVKVGDMISLTVKDGVIISKVEEVRKNDF